MELFEGEIGYGRSTLPECCMMISKHMLQPYSDTFSRIHDKMRENKGESFDEVYRKEMQICLAGLPLTKEDRQLMLSVFAGDIYADYKMQLRAIERHLEGLRQIIGTLEGELAGKSRMAIGLGAMGGLLLVVVLI